MNYLIAQGLPEDRIKSEGRGNRDTQFEESTRDQPELRRRVEIYINPIREE
jgi:outer membrane protein OmpA-like peptidoglycan-associated protein